MNNDNSIWKNKIEKTICAMLNLEDLSAGLQIIRNDRKWRENEKYIDYIWIVTINKCFTGSLSLFSIKFNSNTFREIENKQEIISGIVKLNSEFEVDISYQKTTIDLNFDLIRTLKSFDLFESHKGITLDGIDYDILIKSSNIETRINLNNPNSKSWLEFVEKINTIGSLIAIDSNNQHLIHFCIQ